MTEKLITRKSINQNITKLDFPWPSPILTRSYEILREIEQGGRKEFPEVLLLHAGNPQEVGQKPLTFFRQVISVCLYPDLMEDLNLPSDVKEKAKLILHNCRGHSVGAYSDSPGIEIFRQEVAKFLGERDGVPRDYNNIILSSGATDGIKSILMILNHSKSDKPPGIMIPLPQYPLYSALAREYGMYEICYFLDEENEWALSIQELKRAINEARAHCEPRVLVVVNPGNPTGSVLTYKNTEDIVKFAHEEKLFLVADEVYQDNVFAEDVNFHSFHKVMSKMGPPYSDMELASVMSASKGYIGECGMRGGCLEVFNLDPDVQKMLFKAVSAHLCPSILGQIMMYLLSSQPKPGDPSFLLFEEEKNAILQNMRENATFLTEALNKIKGIKCNKVAGAMYAFPRLLLPPKFIEKAKSLGQEPDFFYCMELVEKTGICSLPGSQFLQKPGTYHIRMTFLPPVKNMKAMAIRLKEFHQKILAEYS
ncbi:alanine aminotransferase 2-like [Limulus polyphemus]|uniref:alanine transaminase n=1 Tax=Limulus polyphemus TaxID=6850 RepID=A0ABM1BMS9_LIMPO|nr:alanine aminotransferase 2-like [Limulus polyphemus]